MQARRSFVLRCKILSLYSQELNQKGIFTSKPNTFYKSWLEVLVVVLFLGLAALFSLMVAIFAVQNPELVTIKFLFWQLPGVPQVMVIFGAAMAGMIATWFLNLSRYLRATRQLKDMKGYISLLESEIAKLKQGDSSPTGTPHKER